MGIQNTITIGDEISDSNLQLYDSFVHTPVFPPSDTSGVTTLVADGHHKIRGKTECTPDRKRTGRPRKKTTRKGGKHKKTTNRKDRKTTNPDVVHNNGWMMICEPSSGRVVAAASMDKPENNAVLQMLLLMILWLYPNMNCLVYDRACAFMPSAMNIDGLMQIVYYIVDLFHALRHKASCKCNPRKIARLKRRIKGVNTQICEQTFSWFRTYARSFNELRLNRHKFIVLYFCTKHNAHIDTGAADYLPSKATGSFKAKSRSYSCTKQAMKTMKAMRTMKAMKTLKAMKTMKAMTTIKKTIKKNKVKK